MTLIWTTSLYRTVDSSLWYQSFDTWEATSQETVPIQKMSEQGSTLLLVHLERYQSASFNRDTSKRDAKRAVYERLILSICLYGCESWCLKETLYTELRQFHARCVRTMSRMNLHHTWIHRISTKNLEKELAIGFRFDEQLHCSTSITMAWARKSYAFWSSPQTHALFMVPRTKMQRCHKDELWQNYEKSYGDFRH